MVGLHHSKHSGAVRGKGSSKLLGNKMRAHLLKCEDVASFLSIAKITLPLEFCTRKFLLPSTAPAGNLTQRGIRWLHAQCVVFGFTKHAVKFQAQFSETKIESRGNALHATNN